MDRIGALSTAGNCLPADATVKYGRQLASSLSALHRHGLVHGDVKPSNVIITSEDRARLIDFELTVPLGTSTGVRRQGTCGYLSPGQVAGGPATEADDIHALGAFSIS